MYWRLLALVPLLEPREVSEDGDLDLITYFGFAVYRRHWRDRPSLVDIGVGNAHVVRDGATAAGIHKGRAS